MRIVNCQDTAFYRPRQPWDSPLYRLLEEHFDEFERVYPDRFQRKYGDVATSLRSVPDITLCSSQAVSLRSALEAGRAQGRQRLPRLRRSARGIRPRPLPRLPVRVLRRLLLQTALHLPLLAWETVLDVCRAVLGRDDIVAGMVAAIHTHGQLSNWHPHLHCLTTYGAFTSDLSAPRATRQAGTDRQAATSCTAPKKRTAGYFPRLATRNCSAASRVTSKS